MEELLASVPDADRTSRREVLSFLASRYERASRILRDAQWESYRDFTQLWLETCDWRDEAALTDYLGLEPEQRLARFERFRRQAGSWDVTLEFPLDETSRKGEARAKWRQDFAGQRQRMKEREERDASHWESVQQVLQSERALPRMSGPLRAAFELLALPADASLADARTRYRDLARKAHPDLSGKPEEMVALNDAWEKIMEFFLS